MLKIDLISSPGIQEGCLRIEIEQTKRIIIMKRTILYVIILSGLSLHIHAQKLLSGGIGYFGETGVYPGVVFELEYEKYQSEHFSTISGVNVGGYIHARSHAAAFIDIQQGLRRTLSNRIILESRVGLGVMLSFYTEEVYTLNESGLFEETSRIASPDLMPSFTLGLGYDFSRNREKRRMAWVRPRIFWQYPYNSLILPHLSLQIGYTHTF